MTSGWSQRDTPENRHGGVALTCLLPRANFLKLCWFSLMTRVDLLISVHASCCSALYSKPGAGTGLADQVMHARLPACMPDDKAQMPAAPSARDRHSIMCTPCVPWLLNKDMFLDAFCCDCLARLAGRGHARPLPVWGIWDGARQCQEGEVK